MLFTFLRDRWRWVAWALLAGGMLAGLLMSISWSDAAFWFRSTSQSEPTRERQSTGGPGETCNSSECRCRSDATLAWAAFPTLAASNWPGAAWQARNPWSLDMGQPAYPGPHANAQPG